MLRIILIIIGTISLALGILGIPLPGLPTTPFLLVAAACYVRSSEKLYNWLLNHKVFGKYIKRFQERKAMSISAKVISLSMMTVMVSLSVIFLIESLTIRLIVIGAGLAGAVTVLVFPTWRPDKEEDKRCDDDETSETE